MTIHAFTIVLDGMPWLPLIYAELRKLSVPWHWHVAEGVAANHHDTSWCNSLPPRLSRDGTSQWLTSLSFDKRVTVQRKKLWDGKLEMVNAPLASITEPCLLWEMDSDELWTARQMEACRRLFLTEPSRTSAQFYCRYFVGPDLVVFSPGLYGNRNYDWHRVWRFEPGMRFTSHEPPRLAGLTVPEHRFTQAETAAAGLVFDHYAYATEQTVAFKQRYYQGKRNLYKNAVAEWRRLQACPNPTMLLRDFLSWVDDDAMARRL